MVGGQGTAGSAEVFFPSDPACYPIASTNHHRANACVVATGRFVYVLGGWNGECQNSVERYEPGLDPWHQNPPGIAVIVELSYPYKCLGVDKWIGMAPMGKRRTQFGAAVVGGRIYAVGGRDDTGQYLGSVERYSVELDTWRPVSPILVERYSTLLK